MQSIFAIAGCGFFAYGSEMGGLRNNIENNTDLDDNAVEDGYGFAAFFAIMGAIVLWCLSLFTCIMMKQSVNDMVTNMIGGGVVPVDGETMPPVDEKGDAAAV